MLLRLRYLHLTSPAVLNCYCLTLSVMSLCRKIALSAFWVMTARCGFQAASVAWGICFAVRAWSRSDTRYFLGDCRYFSFSFFVDICVSVFFSIFEFTFSCRFFRFCFSFFLDIWGSGIFFFNIWFYVFSSILGVCVFLPMIEFAYHVCNI